MSCSEMGFFWEKLPFARLRAGGAFPPYDPPFPSSFLSLQTPVEGEAEERALL